MDSCIPALEDTQTHRVPRNHSVIIDVGNEEGCDGQSKVSPQVTLFKNKLLWLYDDQNSLLFTIQRNVNQTIEYHNFVVWHLDMSIFEWFLGKHFDQSQ